MNATRRRGVRLAAAAVISALGLSLLAPPPASAAGAGGCKLTWLRVKVDKKNYVKFFLRCTPERAGDSIWKINLWGDDEYSDDLLRVRYTTCTFPTTARREFVWTEDENTLDEDLLDRDEVYAGVWFRRPNGTTYGIRSNTVAGWWGEAAYIGFSAPPLPLTCT